MTDHAVVVTGAASGLGAAVAARLLDRGCWVTALDHDARALETLPSHGSLTCAAVDVTDERAVQAVFADLERPATGLVTCAGVIGQRQPLGDVDVTRMRRLLDVHLLGTVLPCRAFAAQATGGAIVTIASVVGLGGFTNHIDYGPAKAAVVNATQVMAVELAPRGVRVNCVAPGFIAAGMTTVLADEGYDLDAVSAAVPMGRLGSPADVATAVAFLLLDAGYVTGAVLPVDGGWTANGR